MPSILATFFLGIALIIAVLLPNETWVKILEFLRPPPKELLPVPEELPMPAEAPVQKKRPPKKQKSASKSGSRGWKGGSRYRHKRRRKK